MKNHWIDFLPEWGSSMKILFFYFWFDKSISSKRMGKRHILWNLLLFLNNLTFRQCKYHLVWVMIFTILARSRNLSNRSNSGLIQLSWKLYLRTMLWFFCYLTLNYSFSYTFLNCALLYLSCFQNFLCRGVIRTHVRRVAPDWDLSDALPTEQQWCGTLSNF